MASIYRPRGSHRGITENIFLRSPGFVRLGFIVSLLLLSSTAFAQYETDDVAPPPIKLLSKTERSQLKAKAEIKDRTVLSLQLMESRLKSAEKYRVDENYTLMFAELGGFHALMDNTLEFLLRWNEGEGKRLNNLKRFEIGLRGYVPRIEGIRREVPSSFEPYVKSLLKYISDTREKAMEPFFSQRIVGMIDQDL